MARGSRQPQDAPPQSACPLCALPMGDHRVVATSLVRPVTVRSTSSTSPRRTRRLSTALRVLPNPSCTARAPIRMRHDSAPPHSPGP